MRNKMQAHQGGVGQIETPELISWLGRTANDRKEVKGVQRNVKAKTRAKTVRERKGLEGETNDTSYLEYDLHYVEDNMIGIAWCDVVLK
ncbi:MAG TPA: hypothetical protein VMT12_11165 [Syntrophales bacterium]|nr:hypothetical protein [Syntrophales bacterium]